MYPMIYADCGLASGTLHLSIVPGVLSRRHIEALDALSRRSASLVMARSAEIHARSCVG
jgi:hypothetical protein